MTTDISIPCLRCSRPAQREHHPDHKKMGGRGPKAPELAHELDPLCRRCHDEHHTERFDYDKVGDFYVGTKGGDFRSPTYYDELGTDRRLWSLEHLRREWHEADEVAVYAYKDQCQAAHVLKERFAWMPEWYEHAAVTLSLDEEKPVDWRRVYDRVKAWETFEVLLGGGDVWSSVYLLGERGRLAVAKHEDPEWALRTAIDARLGGDSIAEVERQLRGEESLQQSETERCTCGNCGHEHNKKGA